MKHIIALEIILAAHLQADTTTPLTAPALILNMQNEETLPRNFRTCLVPFRETVKKTPPREGLDDLNLSGSSQFSEKALKAIYEKIGKPEILFVFDLRNESHGFIDGAAVSWYTPRDWINKGKSAAQILAVEKQLLDGLKRQKEVVVKSVQEKNDSDEIIAYTDVPMKVNTISNEDQITKLAKANYRRIYAVDHQAPSANDVDMFIAFYRQVPQGAWVHMHCSAGDGRTTTFMAMFDMLRNAKKISFEDIVNRQALIGGIDLLEVGDPKSWKFPLAKQRADFLEQFYRYAKDNSDGYKTPWTMHRNRIIN